MLHKNGQIVLPVVNSLEKLWLKESDLFIISHKTYNTWPKSVNTARILASGQTLCLLFRVRSCQSRSKKGVITLKVTNQVIYCCPQTVISLYAHRTSRADLSARACLPCSDCVAETLKWSGCFVCSLLYRNRCHPLLLPIFCFLFALLLNIILKRCSSPPHVQFEYTFKH